MLKSTAFLTLLALPAQADQDYNVFLGGHQIGTLTYSGTQSHARLTSNFNSTPMGVFDGTYEGESRPTPDGVTYRGKSVSTHKSREVETRTDKTGQITQVHISPEKDRTPLSIPAAIPAGVFDPVAGFGQLITHNDCPAAFQLYDGRRVIQITPAKTTTKDDVTACQMDYRVVQGKGHLSPLYIKTIKIKIVFDPAQPGPSLITLRSGLFEVEFRRN